MAGENIPAFIVSRVTGYRGKPYRIITGNRARVKGYTITGNKPGKIGGNTITGAGEKRLVDPCKRLDYITRLSAAHNRKTNTRN